MSVLSGLIPFVIIVILQNAICNAQLRNKKSDKNLQVLTTSGIVQGRKDVTVNGTPFWAYQGIPYAKPPLGNLRFRSPVPNDPWKGILDATKERPTCVETYTDANQGIMTWGVEDCLFVNVYASRDPKKSTVKLPVLVWIYGGAFAHGNSSSKFYGNDNLLEHDMILVTFNYRIGIFGFLSTGDMASPGNYGLKDQALVLKWIQKNIENFGGDKNRVTIFGQSAGASSVLFQILSPGSEGLFHRAVASSGSPLCLWSYPMHPREVAFDVAEAAGIHSRNTKDIMIQLRKMDINVLKKAARLVSLVHLPQLDKDGFAIGPTVEPPHKEAFITEIPYDSFESGRFNRVPLLMGMNTLETALFADAVSLLRPVIFRYDLSPSSLPNPSMNIRTFQEKSEAGTKIKERYFKDTVVDASTEELLRYTTDDQFIRPLTKTAQLMWKHIPLYFYVFSYASNYGTAALRNIIINRPDIKGVSHLEEQWYIWKRRELQLPRGADNAVSTRVLRLLRNFMEYGNPTPVKEDLLQNIIWPRVSSSDNITQLKIDSDLELMQNYRWEYIQFWESIFKQYAHRPFLKY